MDRFVLTDAQWAKMEPLCLGKPGDPAAAQGQPTFYRGRALDRSDRQPWRDLPPSFGHWNSVFTRFRDWAKADIWKRLFDAVSDDPDMEYAMVDATIVKVHRHGQGAKGDPKPGHRPFERRHDHQNPASPMPSQSRALRASAGTALRHGGVPPLIEGLVFDALIADKAFDSNAIIADLDARGAKVVISQHPRRAKPLAIDEEMYKWRHLIENFFGRLKSSNVSQCALTRPIRASPP